jgi:hypothetical protein
MMDMKLVYRIHKWLAVVVAAATLGWFVSGALMVVPERWLTLSPNAVRPNAEARPGAPTFDQASVPPSDAIAKLSDHLGHPVRVTAINLRRLPDRVAYQVLTAGHGDYFVDARDGTIFSVTESLAKQIVARALGTTADLGPVTVQTEPTLTYAGPLPAYRIPVADGKSTVFFVELATAQAHLTDPLSRAAGLVMGLHGLWLLRRVFPGSAVRALMLALAIAGTAMSLAGVVILLAQLRRWWRRLSPADLATRFET